MRSVHFTKKKKDGTRAYSGECHGLSVSATTCSGDVTWREKHAYSFGVPFVTHANLCDSHAYALNFVTAKEPA